MTPPRIIIRCPNWLGDLMMSLGFIEAVLQKYPQSQIDLIVKKGFESLSLPHRGEIIPYDREKDTLISFSRGLRKKQYDFFYVLPPSFSSALMAFLSGAKIRIGAKGEGRGFLFTKAKTPLTKDRSEHLLKEYLDLLDPPVSADVYVPRLQNSPEWIQKNLPKYFSNYRSNEFIVLAPGATFGPAKQWPVLSYKELAEKLSAHFDIFIMGSAQEKKMGEEIAGTNSKIKNLCGGTNLNEMIAILNESKLLISNDSGAMHVMAALQKPQIALFGSTSPVWTGPLNKNAEIIYLGLECSPCFKRVCPLTHTNCLNQISVEMVLNKIKKYIS
ncbi:MAG: lipopolysaccharide heptosyltransferase II [Elusimicrobiota bacterium]